MSQDRFTAAEIGQLTANPSVTPETAHVRAKNYTADGWIVARQRSTTDKRKTILYSAGDALTAAALGALTDLGGLGKPAIQAAASRLQTWRAGEIPMPGLGWAAAAQEAIAAGRDLPTPPPEVANVPESPAQWMMDTLAADPSRPPGFTLRISWQRHVSGHVNVTASLSHGDFGEVGKGHEIRPDHVPLADLLLPLDPLLQELHARILRFREAH